MFKPLALALQELHQGCMRFAQENGFLHFLFVVHIPVGSSLSTPLIATNYPLPWVEAYDTRGYLRVDPVLQWAMGHVEAFGWDRFDKQAARTRPFWTEAARYSLDRGCSIPKHGPNGAFCFFSLAGQHPPADIAERQRMFEAASTFVARHFEDLLARFRFEADIERLTQRQHDVLALVAKGLTTRSIAERLRLHRRSVEDLLAHACTRLGVRTRVEAVARAVESGQICASLPDKALENPPSCMVTPLQAHRRDTEPPRTPA